jgi:hypothetical protein
VKVISVLRSSKQEKDVNIGYEEKCAFPVKHCLAQNSYLGEAFLPGYFPIGGQCYDFGNKING